MRTELFAAARRSIASGYPIGALQPLDRSEPLNRLALDDILCNYLPQVGINLLADRSLVWHASAAGLDGGKRLLEGAAEVGSELQVS